MKNRTIEAGDDWGTPPSFYLEQHELYNFDFDPCPFHHDLTLWDGLNVEWGARNYINPPYSQRIKEEFVAKGIEQFKKGKFCFFLLPVSTSTKLFHGLIKPNATSIDFVERRLPFYGINTKGQYVNYHQLGGVLDMTETIQWDTGYLDEDDQKIIKTLPKYVKNSGMHDSMKVIFDGR